MTRQNCLERLSSLELGFSLLQKCLCAFFEVFGENKGLAGFFFNDHDAFADVGFQSQPDGFHNLALSAGGTGGNLFRQGLSRFQNLILRHNPIEETERQGLFCRQKIAGQHQL